MSNETRIDADLGCRATRETHEGPPGPHRLRDEQATYGLQFGNESNSKDLSGHVARTFAALSRYRQFTRRAGPPSTYSPGTPDRTGAVGSTNNSQNGAARPTMIGKTHITHIETATTRDGPTIILRIRPVGYAISVPLRSETSSGSRAHETRKPLWGCQMVNRK